jgi:hypothetical protein
MDTRLSLDGHRKAQDHRSRYRTFHLLYRIDPVFSVVENHAGRAVTLTVILAEILTKPSADKNFSPADEIKFTLKSYSSLSAAPIDEKLGEVAALVRARYTIRLPDALQVAAAVHGEATLF